MALPNVPGAEPTDDDKPNYVDAVVVRVKRHMPETGWTVMDVDRAGLPELWVGIMPEMREGLPVRATGKIETHATFGRQFKVSSIVTRMPEATDPEAVARFLSKLVTGIGDRLARRIVDALGADTIPCLEGMPEQLARVAAVRGVGDKLARALSDEWRKHSVEGQIMIGLARFGIRSHIAKRVMKKYGGRSMEVCEKRPYLLALEVDGIGFKTADAIAKVMKTPPDAIDRIEAGLMYSFDEDFASRGHCYATREALIEAAAKLLDLDEGIVADGLGPLTPEAVEQGRKSYVDDGYAVLEGARVFPTQIHRAEVRVATRLARLLKAPALVKLCRPDPMAVADALLEDDVADIGRDVLASMGIASPIQRTDLNEVGEPERPAPPEVRLVEAGEDAIRRYEETTGMVLAETQKEAVRLAMRSKVMILTGGPGTGKSATSRAILFALMDSGFDVSLCAPTGKAAKRLQEATGFPASTVHRLLGYKPDLGFTYRPGNPLPRTAVLVDEASMCDVQLMANLLDGLHDGARLVIVGDVDQLPSVGPGAVLRDLIDSEIIPTVRLTEIFRQAAGSQIIINAHRVNQGLPPLLDADKDSDFFWIQRSDHASALATTLKIVTERLEKRGISTRDCMVISPQKAGKVGINALNERLQAVLNPSGTGLVISERHGIVWREGDPVMQTKNDYEREVFNGETGCIKQVDGQANRMMVDVDGRDVVYERKHFDNVTLAYACTVHKCVAPETVVETHEGLVQMADVNPHGYVASPFGPKAYGNLVSNPIGLALRVLSKDGYEVTITPDHGLDVWRNGRYERVEGKDVVVGDILRVKLGATIEPVGEVVLPGAPAVNVRAVRYRIPDRMTHALAEFMGLMVADGTVYRTGFRLVKRHEAVRERFAFLCKDLFGVTPRSCEVLGTPGYEVCSTQLSKWLKSVGGMAPHNKYVPECIAKSHTQFHASFLRGLFEDGSVHLCERADVVTLDHIELTTKFRKLALMVRVMLLRLGIVAGTTTSRHAHYKFEIYSEYAKQFVDTIGFISASKVARCAVPVGGSDYWIPISESELERLRPSLTSGVYQYAKKTGRIRRAYVLSSKEPWAQERLSFHHTVVRKVVPTESETMCIEVPDEHRFLQNGISGWNSQGSQEKAVIVIMLHEHYRMLSRALLYTALTRGEKLVVLIADPKAVAIALSETRREVRDTGLRERLRLAYGTSQGKDEDGHEEAA